MKKMVKIAQFGLGKIGVECLKFAASKDWAKVVGGIDTDAAKAGKDLGHLTGARCLAGLRVVDSIDALAEKPDLIFHTAVSKFTLAYEQLVTLARKRINIISSCEELLFPQLREPKLAARLDQICRKSGVRVVGTGVNPGFVMDLLPLWLTVVSRDIRAIHVQRVVNASSRREALQRKIGSGLTPLEFARLFRAGKAGHAGLKESLALIAHTLGWRPTKIIETGNAIVADSIIRTKFLRVEKGQTCGLHQRVEARIDGNIHLTLDLKMYLDAKNPQDAIQIEGTDPMNLVIQGGVAGDQATVAALVNTAPRLLRAKPGLRLVTELPLA